MGDLAELLLLLVEVGVVRDLVTPNGDAVSCFLLLLGCQLTDVLLLGRVVISSDTFDCEGQVRSFNSCERVLLRGFEDHSLACCSCIVDLCYHLRRSLAAFALEVLRQLALDAETHHIGSVLSLGDS